MSFFGTILSAAGNAIAPDQAGELGAIAGAIDELSSNHGLDASTTSEIAGVVGKYLTLPGVNARGFFNLRADLL